MSDQQQQQPSQDQSQAQQQSSGGNNYVYEAVEFGEQKALGHQLSQDQTSKISSGIEAGFKHFTGHDIPGSQ